MNIIVEDRYGHRYRLMLPNDVALAVPIRPKEFSDPLAIRSFLQTLRVDATQWRSILARVDRESAQRQRDGQLIDAAAEAIRQKRIKVFPVTHLNKPGPPRKFPLIQTVKGDQYQLLPASVLLVNSYADITAFRSVGEAETFLQTVGLGAPQASDIVEQLGLSGQSLVDIMTHGEVIAVKQVQVQSSAQKIETVSAASSPGNRPATLGPHDGAGGSQAPKRQTSGTVANSAIFGNATSSDYRATFFAVNPELEGQVVVHHAVEQQVLTRYPGVVSESEIHSLENLRGIPNELNADLHLSQIRREWNQFYRQTPNPTQEMLLQKATEIDTKFGIHFNPSVGR